MEGLSLYDIIIDIVTSIYWKLNYTKTIFIHVDQLYEYIAEQ